MEKSYLVSSEEDNVDKQKKSELFRILCDHQKDLREFKRKFSSEDDCRNRLREWRWPNGFICDRCGSKKEPYRNTNRNIYQCKHCGYQASLTAGTIFQKTRLPLRRWFFMIYLFGLTDEKIPLSYFQRLWNTNNYKAVWVMADKIKQALAESDKYLRLVGLVK